jgi:hypothetical protein
MAKIIQLARPASLSQLRCRLPHNLQVSLWWVPEEGHQNKNQSNKCSNRQRKNDSLAGGER